MKKQTLDPLYIEENHSIFSIDKRKKRCHYLPGREERLPRSIEERVLSIEKIECIESLRKE